MKITKSLLRKIIKEELKQSLLEEGETNLNDLFKQSREMQMKILEAAKQKKVSPDLQANFNKAFVDLWEALK